jgi:hypothetical protein
MAINFPTSPANGATLTSGGKTWQYASATNAWSIVTDPAQIQSITTTPTSGGTTTLDSSANFHQFFTGSSAHTLVLPVVSTLSLGQYYMLHNNSTGTLTVQSSGLNLIVSVPGNTTVKCTVLSTSGTTAASWDADFQGFTSITGTGSAVLSNTPTLVTPNIGAATGTSLATTGTISTSAGNITAVGGSLTARAAATQDSVILTGRAGGTSTFGVTLTPATLTASRTLTLPDVAGNIVVDANPAITLSTSAGNTTVSGTLTTNVIRELPTTATVATNAITVDLNASTSIQRVAGSSLTGNLTVNVTNPIVGVTAGIYTITIVLTQSTTGRIPSVLQIGGTGQTIKWQGGTAPTGTSVSGKIDLFSFILLWDGSAWTVFGSSNLNY